MEDNKAALKKLFLIAWAAVTLLALFDYGATPEKVTVTKTVTKTDRVYVPDTEYKTITKEVDMPPTKDCVTYVEKVGDMDAAMVALSHTKGDLEALVVQVKAAAGSGDVVESVRLREEGWAVENLLDNLYNELSEPWTWLTLNPDACK
jgi:hypothetical protein